MGSGECGVHLFEMFEEWQEYAFHQTLRGVPIFPRQFGNILVITNTVIVHRWGVAVGCNPISQ